MIFATRTLATSPTRSSMVQQQTHHERITTPLRRARSPLELRRPFVRQRHVLSLLPSHTDRHRLRLALFVQSLGIFARMALHRRYERLRRFVEHAGREGEFAMLTSDVCGYPSNSALVNLSVTRILQHRTLVVVGRAVPSFGPASQRHSRTELLGRLLKVLQHMLSYLRRIAAGAVIGSSSTVP